MCNPKTSEPSLNIIICFILSGSLLLDYDFNKLEDIWFTSASHFTMATMELLMDRLPELTSIGKRNALSQWIFKLCDALLLLRFLISICISIPFSILLLVGQLSGWNLNADDIVLLKGILKSSNSCLTLSPANIYS